jgi:hypothetical protein
VIGLPQYSSNSEYMVGIISLVDYQNSSASIPKLIDSISVRTYSNPIAFDMYRESTGD